MTKLETLAALRHGFPLLTVPRDYLVADNGTITAWHPPGGTRFPRTAPTTQQLATWLAEAQEAERLAAFPAITPRQLRLWLVSAGLTPVAVDAQIALIPDATDRAKAEIEWQHASEYQRTHPLVIQLGAALGLSSSQIDTAFTAASKL